MLDAFVQGFLHVFAWPTPGYLLLGVMMGIILGAVPGLGGVIGLVILLPFTFDMETIPAIALLLGMFSVTSTSDTIASVLLGIPGTAASQATVLDGHPLAKQGHAERAFGAAFTVSAFGGVFGALILAVSLPLVLPIILAFSKAELFMLGVLGLTMVGSLTGRVVVKGLLMACLGLLMACVGYGQTMPVPRFYFGFDYLLDGLPLLPVILGLFAIPELIELAAKNSSISQTIKSDSQKGDLFEGVKDAFRHWGLTLRCSLIGTYVGILPGLGSSIVDWIAYGHAVQTAKDKSKFGTGDIRGVIAPEAANNAVKGGSLIPTVAFGIPGSLGAAILLGALIIQGIQPGPEMLTTKLDVTFSLVWTIAIANIIGAGLLMVWCKPVARIAFIPGQLIIPAVITFVMMGAWLTGVSIGDWISVIVMGFIGYVMKRGGWPRPPLVLALILGSIMEQTFQISMRAHQGPSWLWERPIVVLLGLLCLITIALAARGIIKTKRDETDKDTEAGEGNERNALISLPFSITLAALFTYAAIASLGWPSSAARFPFAIALPAIAMALFTCLIDARSLRSELATAGGLGPLWSTTKTKIQARKSAVFFAYLLGLLLLSLLVGQKIALPVYVAVYLIRWGNYAPYIAIGYALVAWGILIAFYDRVMHLVWYPSLLSEWLPAYLPEGLPLWLIF
ncbi:tripartite tricarboxylate transporter permease [Alphaproteobacteria bacterium KMM 3653]|uniref:Tripartite tricarboxylate transporter permease n=1 Tax=Harenicola maris TaxID=2841044 RepID=A0AAP2CLX2_9RHOB|nr:tripartite tricarboxylate transporter permease [Harenicola maris]